MSGVIWVWAAVLVLVVGGYWLYRSSRLGKLKLPSLSSLSSKLTVEQIEVQTGKERAKTIELRKVLDAKKSLAEARAENARLLKEIGGVSESSVEKEKREEQKAQEEKKVKPRRL